jgi:hypothetical protein
MPKDEIDMQMWVTTHWRSENTSIDARLGQIDEAHRDTARIILKIVSECPQAVQVAELTSRFLSSTDQTISRTIKKLVTIDLLSIARGTSI